MDSKMFRRTEELKQSGKGVSPYDEEGNERVLSMPQVAAGWDDDREAFDKVRLWDIWVPRKRVLLSFACGKDGLPCGDPVRKVDWDGPEAGPFVPLVLGKGRGIMRLAPISSLIDLNDAINKSYRKMVRQSERQKTLLAVGDGAEKDGDIVANGDDGMVVRVSNPQLLREMSFGGVDQATLAFALTLTDKFSYMAGNLDAQGGLAQAGDTLGQEELLRQSASQTIEDMQGSMVKFTKSVVESVSSWVFYDPVTVYRIMKPIGASGIEIPVALTPKDREESDYQEIELDIRPVSMQDQGNSQRLRGLLNAWEKVIIPGMPAIERQGMMLDIRALLTSVSELSGIDEIGQLLKAMPTGPSGPGGAPGESGGESPSKPPVTTRNYNRRSVPTGGTRSARDNVMAQVLSGGKPTPQQSAMMGRKPA
jgi:hypothetical protein